MEPFQLAWPDTSPRHGSVMLRPFEDTDVEMVIDLATDPYVPLIGSLPARADVSQAADWIARQRARLGEGAGFSFAIAEASSGDAVGAAGLWLAGWQQGRANVGYSVAPRARGRGLAGEALSALVEFAWSIPQLFRLEAHIEPSNTGSIRSAERAGFVREGLLRSHQCIGDTRRDMLLYATVRPSA